MKECKMQNAKCKIKDEGSEKLKNKEIPRKRCACGGFLFMESGVVSYP